MQSEHSEWTVDSVTALQVDCRLCRGTVTALRVGFPLVRHEENGLLDACYGVCLLVGSWPTVAAAGQYAPMDYTSILMQSDAV